jgi:hypothetical protein
MHMMDRPSLERCEKEKRRLEDEMQEWADRNSRRLLCRSWKQYEDEEKQALAVVMSLFAG